MRTSGAPEKRDDTRPLLTRDEAAGSPGTDLSSYIYHVLNGSLENDEPSSHKWFRWGANAGAFALGAVAALPWLNSGKLVADALGVSALEGLCDAGLIISFGLTAAWALQGSTNTLLQPKPVYVKRLQSHHSRANAAKHIACHLLGLSTTVPAVYVTIIYNDTLSKQIGYAVISAVSTYALSTLGYYKLLDYFASLLKKPWRGNVALTQQEQFAKRLNNLMPYLERNFEAINELIERTNERTVNEYVLQLLQRIDNENPEYLTPPTNKILEIGLKIFLLTTVPTILEIFRIYATYMAIESATDLPILGILGTAVVNIPLYVLVLFAMNTLADLSAKKAAQLVAWRNVPESHFAIHYPKMNILTFMGAVIFSGFSALTNGYVAYDLMSKTALSPAKWLFAVGASVNGTVFQSISCLDVANDLVVFGDSCRSDVHLRLFRLKQHLPELTEVVKKTSNDEMEAYRTSYARH